MIRLLKPIQYYKDKYGSYSYALNRLYLLMEKQHNRGQEAAGIGIIKMHTTPGHEYVFRERALGSNAIQDIFATMRPKVEKALAEHPTPQQVETEAPFIGEIYMGHLRYSTTGKGGMSYVHPFLRRNNWPARNLLMCGNFNMTNVDSIFNQLIGLGQHPRIYSDTIALLEQLGFALDNENQRLHDLYAASMQGLELSQAIEDNIDMRNILADTAPSWDGGYVICCATGSGDMAVLRDPCGIRPCFFYRDDEIVVVASERPVIQTVMNVPRVAVEELQPGEGLIINKKGELSLTQILPKGENQRCSFERIYFSRGSDADIYRERKSLGRNLVAPLIDLLGDTPLDECVFSFIPNTAEVAFVGMVEGLQDHNNKLRCQKIMELCQRGELNPDSLAEAMKGRVRIEKVAIKDIKLRTFIAAGDERNEMATHVYDVTYGIIRNDVDTLIVIDDSIVRGTTLKQSIIAMLDRLHPKRIIVLSSSPQVRYPDYYGIDMSRMGEFIAFRAALELNIERGNLNLLEDVYRRCVAMDAEEDDTKLENCVKKIYEPFTDEEISRKIAEMLTPVNTKAKVDILYQSMDGLKEAVPTCPGNWYFSGDYPTPGGIRLVNRAYINYYEGRADQR